MAAEPDTRDRLIRLEVEVTHLTNKLEDVSDKVSEMHDVLMKATGAKWLLFAIIAGLGFVAGKIGALTAWFRP
jgi:hypothetical protein